MIKLFLSPRINLLSLFTPCINPHPLTTGKRVTAHSQCLTNGRSTGGMQAYALCLKVDHGEQQDEG